MADIGSWWVAGHESQPDETVVSAYYVNYLRPEKRPLGGKLYLTTHRILFCPHLIDAVFGGERLAIAHEDVERVRKIERGDPSLADDDEGGGSAERLRLERVDGSHASFILTDLDAAVEEMRDSIV